MPCVPRQGMHHFLSCIVPSSVMCCKIHLSLHQEETHFNSAPTTDPVD